MKKSNKIIIKSSMLIFCLISILAAFLNTHKKYGAVPIDASDSELTKEDELAFRQVAGDELEIVKENEFLILYVDHRTGGIAVEDKQTGYIYYSSPKEAMEDTKASDDNKQILSSFLRLTYYDRKNKTESSMNSFRDARLPEQITYAKLEDGIRIRLVLGKEEAKYILPRQMSQASFEEILNDIPSERRIKQMKAFYLFYSLENTKEEEKEELLKKYPALADTDLYVLKSSASDRDKKLLEEAFREAGLTMEGIEEEYKNIQYEGESESLPCFQLDMDFDLEGDRLKTNLHVDAISYDEERYYLVGIYVLPYFGAGKTGEDGYIFLPDGSGTIIPFHNDGSPKPFLTRGKMYGIDGAETAEDRGCFKNEFRLPVFGVKSKDNAILGMIEEGDAISAINGELGNINHQYNTAYGDFLIRKKEIYMEDGAFEQIPWIMYDKQGFKDAITITYAFLSGENADYVGMAKAYQKLLIDRKQLKPLEKTDALPLILETIGSVKRAEKIMGIPVLRETAVTSFEEAFQMAEDLKGEGLYSIKLRYKGWYNGGYYHTASSAMRVSKALGGLSGLKKLSQKLNDLGISLFMDVNFAYHDMDNIFDGYTLSRNGIRDVFSRPKYYPQMDLSSLSMKGWYYPVNPPTQLKYFTSFTKDYEKTENANISLGSMGSVLNSNYKTNAYMNRQSSKKTAEEILSRADDKYDSVMVDYGNSYAFSYSDYILYLPLKDSSYWIAEESIPFAQIVLHGYLWYAGEPMNLSSIYERDVLRAIEYGAVPYFLITNAKGSLLKEAYITDQPVYSTEFAQWKDNIVETFRIMNAAFDEVSYTPIIDHEKIADNVYATTYENNITIVVNYNQTSVNVFGTDVDGMSYKRIQRQGV